MDASAPALTPGTELMAPAQTAPVPVAPNTPLERLKALPPRQKWTAGAGLVGLLVLAMVLSLYARQDNYKPLFLTEVSEKDSYAAIELLQKLDVPYKVTAGQTLIVPAERAAELRLQMSSLGLPKKPTSGYEHLDNPRFGMSQQQERDAAKRGLEAAIAQSVMYSNAVEHATVILALPQTNGFFREQTKPTASVRVTLRPGHTLDRAQADSIVHLVSSAVPDMAPNAVKVVDQNDNTLSKAGDDNGRDDLTQQQRKHVQETEKALLKRVNDILEPALGKENLRATVTADLDFNQVESTSEAFRPNQTPDAAAIRSQHNVETNGPGQPQPAGVPGAASNQPPTPASAPMTGASAPLQGAQGSTVGGGGRKESQINYEVDRKVDVVRNAVGVLRRVNVAVVVNHRSVTDPKGKSSVQPVPQEELDKLTALVQEAVGFSKDRGDSVKVVSMPFRADLYPKPEELPLWQQPWLLQLLKTAGVPLVLLVVALSLVFGVIRPALKKDEPPEPEVDEDAERLNAVVDGPEALPAPDNGLIDAEEEVSPHMAEQLEDARLLARENPLAVANILRTWVHGEQAV